MKVIGLTGGIGTGKSTIAGLFRGKGVPVIDLDEIVRELQKPGKEVYRKIISEFGESIVDEKGEIKRKELGRVVFADANKREKLNKLVHPAVLERLKDLLFLYEKEREPVVVVEIPLLFELKLMNIFDAIIVVYAPENIQINRVMQRDNVTREEATNRIKSQISIEEKKERSDYVIDNSGDISVTTQQFEKVYKDLMNKTVKV